MRWPAVIKGARRERFRDIAFARRKSKGRFKVHRTGAQCHACRVGTLTGCRWIPDGMMDEGSLVSRRSKREFVMKMQSKLARHLGLAAIAVVSSTAATQATISTWNLNMVVPNNIDGLYVNVETGGTGATGGVIAGWDINPYGTSTTTMSWFNATGSGMVQGLGQGGTTSATASLSVGSVVNAASTYAAVASSPTAGGWVLNSVNYFGFKFLNAASQVRYGYGSMTMGATMGVRTLNFVAFEDNGGGITVPAPGAIALLGLAGLAGRRRRD